MASNEPIPIQKVGTGTETKMQILTVENRVELIEGKMTQGFERMFEKMENMSTVMQDAHKAAADREEKLEKKVDKIHDGIYDPEKGLYTRLKTVEDVAIPAKKNREKVYWIIAGGFLAALVTFLSGILIKGTIG